MGQVLFSTQSNKSDDATGLSSPSDSQSLLPERSRIFRAKSNPAIANTSAPSGEGVKRTPHSFAALAKEQRNHDRMLISPEALQKLHLKHEEYMNRQRPEACRKAQNTSNAALKAAFGENDSWQLHGVLPRSEEPYAKRGFEFWSAGSGEACWSFELERWGVGLLSTKGFKGKRDARPGQDNCSVSFLTNGWQVFCVMDGHGEDGHWVSTRASRTMPFYLQDRSSAQMLLGGGFEAALTSAFLKVESDLEVRSRMDNIALQVSGSTATVAIRSRFRNELWVATVGDSRAILVVPGMGAVYSTRDHKPSEETEAKRLAESGAQVECIRYADGDVDARVYVKDERYPGLAMSRSLGDVCVKDYGVVAAPEVVKWKLNRSWNTCYYLACSDGVWDYLKTDEVADFVLKEVEAGTRCGEIAEMLGEMAKERWVEEEDGDYCDDITVLLVPLDCRMSLAQKDLHSKGECFAACAKSCTIV